MSIIDDMTYQQYVVGIFSRSRIAGLEIMLIGSNPRASLRNLFVTSPRPCHVSISTRIYDMKFVIVGSALDDCTLANGCGNCCVGDQGILQKLELSVQRTSKDKLT